MNIHRLLLLIILLCASSSWAGEKRHGPKALEIRVSLGTAAEEMNRIAPVVFSQLQWAEADHDCSASQVNGCRTRLTR